VSEPDRLLGVVALLSDPNTAGLLLAAAATIAIMVAGFALMLPPARRAAGRLIALGAFLAVMTALTPAAFAHAGRTPGVVPNWALFWMAIIGAGALAFGAVRTGVPLVMPAATRFAVVPAVESALGGSSGTLADALTGIALVLGAVFLLRNTLRAVFAKRGMTAVGGGSSSSALGIAAFALRILGRHRD